jgi:hypothetical protein
VSTISAIPDISISLSLTSLTSSSLISSNYKSEKYSSLIPAMISFKVSIYFLSSAFSVSDYEA